MSHEFTMPNKVSESIKAKEDHEDALDNRYNTIKEVCEKIDAEHVFNSDVELNFN